MQAEEIEIQIWAYIDGDCTISEQQRVAALIAKDAEWKETYDNLLALHKTVQTGIEPEQVSSSFTDNVMAKIETPVAQKTIMSIALTWGIRAITAFFIISFGVILAFYIATADFSLAETTAIARPEFTIPATAKPTIGMFAGFVMLIFLLMMADTLFRRRMA